MSLCFSCGKDFSGDVNGLLLHFKKQYLEHGIERFFYKTEKNGSILIAKKDQFQDIFNKQIKPNFDKGAEYAFIQEYNP